MVKEKPEPRTIGKGPGQPCYTRRGLTSVLTQVSSSNTIPSTPTRCAGANHCPTLPALFFPQYLPHFCASCHRLAIQALTAGLASVSQVLSSINASWAAVRHLLFNPITDSELWEQMMWTWGHLKCFCTCLNTGICRGQDRETGTSPTPFSVTATLNVRSLHCRQQGPLFPCTATDVTVSHGWARPSTTAWSGSHLLPIPTLKQRLWGAEQSLPQRQLGPSLRRELSEHLGLLVGNAQRTQLKWPQLSRGSRPYQVLGDSTCRTAGQLLPPSFCREDCCQWTDWNRF